MTNKHTYLGLDVGERRIGLALADSIGRIAQPNATLLVDGTERDMLEQIIKENDVTNLVVGRPRNQAGELSEQTASVERFVQEVLVPIGLPIHWQDESLTSVIAEERLLVRKKPYQKADIDAEAAAIILQDYLNEHAT